jgi:hypothetical protein
MPGSRTSSWRMSIMLSSRLNSITGPLNTMGLRQSGLLALRRAEIGDGEIEPLLRLPKFTPAMFDSVP